MSELAELYDYKNSLEMLLREPSSCVDYEEHVGMNTELRVEISEIDKQIRNLEETLENV